MARRGRRPPEGRPPLPQELSLTALDDGGLVCVVRDVSEQVETENLYRTVAENIPGRAAFLFDEGFRYTLVAGRAFRTLDVTTEELEGRTIQEVIPEDQREAVAARYESVLEWESSQFELEFVGRVFDVSLHPLDALHDDHAGIGIAQDITERHRRERSLRALHDASRQLTYADTVDETARGTVDIAEEVLDCPLSTLWRYDAATDGLRLAGLSLSTLLQYSDPDRMFNFLHTVTGRVSAADYLGIATLDPSAHDPQDVNTLSSQFDVVVELREADDVGREARVVGHHESPRTWRPL